MTDAPARTVFVVEDDPSVRTSLARVLRSAGMRPRTFGDTAQFLTESHACSEGCIVLDLQMSKLSAEELRARLHEAEIDLPIIVLSANDDEENRRAARRLGARFFFRKPIDDQALLDAITWLDHPKTPSDVPNGASPVPGTTLSR